MEFTRFNVWMIMLSVAWLSAGIVCFRSKDNEAMLAPLIITVMTGIGIFFS